jgi:predicted alpha/beta superfamily hydrolase
MTTIPGAILCCTVLASTLFAQKPTTLPGTEEFVVTSEVGGLEYRIDVSLPPNYSAATADRYPTLYLLDGNLEFAMAVQTHRMMKIDGLVPDMIIVAIGYQEDDPAVYTPAYAANRTRDYTPTNVADDPGGGQAAAFLSFLRNQLIPVIDRRYRTDPADRGLGGHSLGGLFTTYTLLHEPALFRRYWLGSPSLWWDRQVPFRWLETAPAPPVGTRVFLSVGEFESDVMVSPMQRMAAGLKSRFPRLDIVSTVHQGENHGSVVPGSIARALRVLYRRPTVPISASDARDLAGRWVSPGGASFRIDRKNGQLVVSDTILGIGFSSLLRAYARDDLFIESLIPYAVTRDSTGRMVGIIRRMGSPDSLYRKVTRKL